MATILKDLPARLFWDTKLADLDPESHADWIIMRVFDRGTLEDIWKLHSYYGRDKVANVLKNAASLKRSDMYLATLIYRLQPADFLCYKQNRFHPGF